MVMVTPWCVRFCTAPLRAVVQITKRLQAVIRVRALWGFWVGLLFRATRAEQHHGRALPRGKLHAETCLGSLQLADPSL